MTNEIPCIGGPCHGYLVRNCGPMTYSPYQYPEDVRKLYRLGGREEIPRDFIRLAYRRERVAFEFGSLRVEGEVLLWNEIKEMEGHRFIVETLLTSAICMGPKGRIPRER